MSGSSSAEVDPLKFKGILHSPRVPSPSTKRENYTDSRRKFNSNKGRKEEKKSKELERLFTQLLYGFEESQESEHQHFYGQEFESDYDIVEDDLFVDLEDDEEYPCELDFCDWRHGRVCRRKSPPKYSKKNSYQANLDTFISFGDKKLRGSNVHLVKRDLKKAVKKILDVEFKKNNVEERLKAKNTPRRGSVRAQINTQPRAQFRQPTKSKQNYYDQNQFVLRNHNADKLGSEAFVSTLMSLQDREITPEDFDLLLQLDVFVEVKTLPKAVIDNLKTEKVENEMANPCMICMDEYEIGEMVKYLKCGHFFHSSCLRTWLTVNSNKCPLDGQEVS